MAQYTDVKALVAALNTATNVIAARIQRLIDMQDAGGLTEAQEDEIHAELVALKATLDAMGQDPAEPLPPPVES